MTEIEIEMKRPCRKCRDNIGIATRLLDTYTVACIVCGTFNYDTTSEDEISEGSRMWEEWKPAVMQMLEDQRRSRLRPIETKYAGYRFRSRLEARWAVFFDHLGVEWYYEPQGFEVDGERYLPDFFLPDVKTSRGRGAWIEIKGRQPSYPSRDTRLAEKIAKYGDYDLFIAFGDLPLTQDSAPAGWMHGFFDNGWDNYQLFYVESDGSVGIDFMDRASSVSDGYWTDSDHERINNALAKARSARFEHGERGAA